MELAKILAKQNIRFDFKPGEKYALLNSLIDFLCDSNRLKNREEIRSAIIKRENQETTGIGNGIAIPHAKIAGLGRSYMSFAIIREGTDFKSMDDAPVDLIFLLVSDQNAPDAHIKALSKLANIVNNPEICTKIRASEKPADIIRILKEHNA